VTTRPEPKAASDPGPFVSHRLASELSGLPPAALADLIQRAAVRTVRIQARVYVSLTDVDRAAREGGADAAL
jgi:hypothetical protein